MQSDFPIQEIFKRYQNHSSVINVAEELNSSLCPRIRLKGLVGSLPSLVIASVASIVKRPFLLVLNDREDAAYCFTDLSNFIQPENLYFFPSSYKRAMHFEQIMPDSLIQRTDTQKILPDLLSKKVEWAIIVTYPDAIAEKVVSIDHFSKNTITVSVNDNISQEFLIDFLIEIGFERSDFVYEPGQFSVRGGIVDVFSYSSALPYRIDFFGDEVESIRSFDVDDQLSREKLQDISIIPNLQTQGLEEKRVLITELTPKDTVIWLRDFEVIIGQINQVFEAAQNKDGFVSGAEFFGDIQSKCIVEFGLKPQLDPKLVVEFDAAPQPAFHKNFDLLAQHMLENQAKGIKTFILAENPAQHRRLENIFQNIDSNISFSPITSVLHEGFVDYDFKACYYTDHQLFDRFQKYKLKNELTKRDSLSIKELLSLQPGDFVVHIDHGIGVFGGLVKSNVNGKVQEAVRLTYKEGDTLFVNIHNLHRISKYRGKESEPPKLYKLGSGAWQKLKQNTKRKVKDIAKELISLYAKRKTEKGYAFTPDTYLQEELEASFIYEDTPDQVKSTQAIKEDMQNDSPMDRLVCGDVGFGKTEVAIRAAFKAVTDSKQVAVLVPTTILALQHYQTFKQRLSNFPCTVEFISRMKTAKAQKDILARLAEGKLDIIIGTHALLGNNIKFKDLGLIIVDEEQKFGVAAKEKLKKLRINVDTLTLTATPIPRTLQFSLMGARDLSIINTPPPNRHPISTELHTFNTDIIKEAVEYEVSRGGQVFFVHNRVQNINEVQIMLSKVCPNVNSVVAHGQMEPAKLEQTMLDFIAGDYDVLISTTIIESGLDIPNANTIIVNNAHMFGLSDLHQLRGRVGRANKKAFCYLLTPPLEGLTQEARRRLKAIEEFSELGSGFSIAMQDLDIRGAGNMLGAEQSGFIADIGFETYHKILDEAIQELKEEEFSDLFIEEKKHKQDQWKSTTDCHIETDMELLIPDWFVSSVPERMRLYRELDSIVNLDELNAFENKLKDRFGELPDQVKELLSVVRLRWIARVLGMEKVLLKNSSFVGYFISNQLSPFYRSSVFAGIIQYIQKSPSKFQLKEQREKLSLTAKEVKKIEDALSMLKHLEESLR